MGLFTLAERLEDQNPTLYLGVGVLSLAKAGLLGRVGRPVGRELRDAGLFIGAGLALRSYQRRRDAREEMEEMEETEGDDTEAAEDEDPEDQRDSADDESVAVADTDEAEGTEEADRRRSPLPGAVADAVERLSTART